MSSLEYALEAVAALTLVDRSLIDYRDLSVDFPLYAVRVLGGNVSEVVESAVERSEPGTSRAFEARAPSAATITLRLRAARLA